MRKLFYPRRIASILRLFFICLIILFSKFSLVPAQEPSGLYQGSEFLTSATAPVIVDGKELFRVSGVTSYPAKERARAIATRIKNLADDRTFDPNKLEIIKEGEVTYIKVGSRNALGLVENDAVREGISLEL